MSKTQFSEWYRYFGPILDNLLQISFFYKKKIMFWDFVSSIRKYLSGGNGPKLNYQFSYLGNKSICFETFHTIYCWWFASTLKISRVYYSPLKLSEFFKWVTFNRGFILFLLCIDLLIRVINFFQRSGHNILPISCKAS